MDALAYTIAGLIQQTRNGKTDLEVAQEILALVRKGDRK